MHSVTRLLSIASFVAPGLGATFSLGSAATYGALAVRGITSSGVSTINGDAGCTGQTIAGFPPGVITGSTQVNTAAASSADSDATAGAAAAKGQASTATLAADPSGSTLTPGVYTFSRGATISSELTLSGNGTFIFNMAATLVTNEGTSIVLIDGAEATNVLWTVGSSASFGAASTFAGSVVSTGTMTLGTGAIIDGTLVAGSSITMDTNTVTAQAA